ncbi:hypothetical protein C1645_739905 [Glomus cerebriforme]|uniref:Uncharacterized protein n=1 Tax=Glomus cerebriforme TaxID=658196 RepID=A0A397SRZ8_9GLOM|nr:hypothetical protein C1645_739905 [Glomus cerebriforme]
MDGLITVIKLQLQIEEVITIRSGSKTLENDELVAELFNTKDNAYEIIIVKNDDESSSNDEEVEKNASNIELTQVEEAFQIKYQGTTLDTFYLRLKSFHDEWYKQSKPYAPYITIIQNSGSGKTRLVGN